MAESQYEKYVNRNPIQDKFFYQEYLKIAETQPPFIFSNGDNPIRVANQFVEMMWVWAPCTVGLNPKAGPHCHTFDEMFLWLGNNPEDPHYLGAEVELWLGEEGAQRDKVTFSTSTLIFVPRGLRHLPIVYKKVQTPLIHLAIGINSGSYSGKGLDPHGTG
jgi:hypothetical protein